MTDMIEPPDLGDFEMRAKAAFERLENEARKMGLYAEQVQALGLPTGQMVLIVDFLIGDVAFSDRVQHPEKHQTDVVVDHMDKSMQTDNFLDQRERIKRNLAAGRDPLDDGDDEDLGH